MKTEILPIDRVTAWPDGFYQVFNPFHPRFYVIPVKVVAEYDQRETNPQKAILKLTITGQRYRIMADGTQKPVGPGMPRKDPHEQTTWTFTGRQLLDGDVPKIIRHVYQDRGTT